MNANKMIRLASMAVAASLLAFGPSAYAANDGVAGGDMYEITPEIVTKVVDGKTVVITNFVTNVVAKAKGAAATMPLAEARAKIGEVINDPSKMTEIMRQLSAEDQKTFVADVNAAIEKLPGSSEDKTAKYLNVNRAALKGASEGNKANIFAVTYASVPPESLVAITERYASDLFNRNADPTHTYSDAEFEKIATEVVSKVEQATAGSDDAGVRNTMAIIMFAQASKGTDGAVQEGLTDKLIETLPDQSTRDLAKSEWVNQALAEGENKSYDSMLAYAGAKQAPNLDSVLIIAGPQMLDALLVDMISGMQNSKGQSTTPMVDQAFGGFGDTPYYKRLDTTAVGIEKANAGDNPRTTDPTKPWNPEYKRGDVVPEPQPEPEPEPEPYPYGNLGR